MSVIDQLGHWGGGGVKFRMGGIGEDGSEGYAERITQGMVNILLENLHYYCVWRTSKQKILIEICAVVFVRTLIQRCSFLQEWNVCRRIDSRGIRLPPLKYI